MAETAEDRAKNKSYTGGDINGFASEMRDFAAQEVEAYKERLKAEVGTLRTMTADHISVVPLSVFKHLIDAVK